MATELVTMSTRELDRLEIVRRVQERRLRQAKTGELTGLSERQIRRLCAAYEAQGAAGMVSRKRGRRSNRRLPDDLQARALALVRERYADFGPRLAHEKLVELHDVRVGSSPPASGRPAASGSARRTSRGTGATAWANSSRSTAASTSGSRIAGPGSRCWSSR